MGNKAINMVLITYGTGESVYGCVMQGCLTDSISANTTQVRPIHGPTDARDRSTKCGVHQLVRLDAKSQRSNTHQGRTRKTRSTSEARQETEPNQADGVGGNEMQRERMSE